MSITVPANMTIVAPSLRVSSPPLTKALQIRRTPFPRQKFAAARAVLNANGRGTLLAVGWSSALNEPLASQIRIVFSAAKNDAAVTQFLLDLETAIVT